VLALIYLQAWSMLLCVHIYINDAAGLHIAYGVKGCVSNTMCVIIVTHVVMWFYANSYAKLYFNKSCEGMSFAFMVKAKDIEADETLCHWHLSCIRLAGGMAFI